MIKLAVQAGASAKFTGSGGAIVGTYTNNKMYLQLEKSFKQFKIKIIKPKYSGK